MARRANTFCYQIASRTASARNDTHWGPQGNTKRLLGVKHRPLPPSVKEGESSRSWSSGRPMQPRPLNPPLVSPPPQSPSTKREGTFTPHVYFVAVRGPRNKCSFSRRDIRHLERPKVAWLRRMMFMESSHSTVLRP